MEHSFGIYCMGVHVRCAFRIGDTNVARLLMCWPGSRSKIHSFKYTRHLIGMHLTTFPSIHSPIPVSFEPNIEQSDWGILDGGFCICYCYNKIRENMTLLKMRTGNFVSTSIICKNKENRIKPNSFPIPQALLHPFTIIMIFEFTHNLIFLVQGQRSHN